MEQQAIYNYIMQAMQQGGTPQQIITALSPYAPAPLIAQVMTAIISAQQPAAPPTFAPPVQPQQFQQQQPQQFQAPASFGGQGQAAGGEAGGSLSANAIAKYGQQLGSAKAGNNHGRSLPIGTHLVEVTEVRAGPTHYGDKFFVEYIALESSNPEVEIGGVYSKGYNFEDKYGHGPNDIRGWLCIAVDHKLQQNGRINWDPRFLDWATNAAQPCKGMVLRVDTWERQPTKPGGNVIMIHEWQAMPNGTRSIGITRAAPAVSMPAAPPVFALQPAQPLPPVAPAFQAQAPQQFAPPAQQQFAPNPQQMVQQPGQFAPPPPGFGQAPPPAGTFPQGAPPQFAPTAAGPMMPPHISALMNQAR